MQCGLLAFPASGLVVNIRTKFMMTNGTFLFGRRNEIGISFLSPHIHYWPQIVIPYHIILNYKDQKNHAHLFICALVFLEDSFHLQYLRLKFILCSLGTLKHGFLGESHIICTCTFIICVLSDVERERIECRPLTHLRNY